MSEHFHSNHPRNILHLAKFYPPEWGGMESVTQDLAIATQSAGHVVAVVAFTNTGPTKREIRDNVQIERARSRTIASQPLSLTWLQRAIKAVRNADIVHIHLPNMLAAMVLPFVPDKTKVVLHWHSDVVGKGVLSWLTRPLEYALARRADAIIATSEPYAKASVVLRKFSDKVDVIPLGIHDPVAAASLLMPDDLSTFIAGRRVLLSVGRLVPYKGFGYLIDAMTKVSSGCCLIIVGGGELLETLLQDIASKDLQSRVMLAGKVPLETLSALFKLASVYVMPSTMRSEAFGVVLIEAMAHSLPVIATQIEGSGVPWVNQDGQTGRNVAPANPTALALAIDEFLGNPAMMSRYAAAARGRYQENFTAQWMTDETLALYGRLIAS